MRYDTRNFPFQFEKPDNLRDRITAVRREYNIRNILEEGGLNPDCFPHVNKIEESERYWRDNVERRGYDTSRNCYTKVHEALNDALDNCDEALEGGYITVPEYNFCISFIRALREAFVTAYKKTLTDYLASLD